jgi:L-alanine-DL-glutamate epimerase-like enolase superfamily enzyme
VSTFDLIAALPLEVEAYELEGLEADVGMSEPRLTTVIRLLGGGEDGIGEDVTYGGLDHVAFQDEGPTLPLEGSWTLESFCEFLGGLDTFPAEPVYEFSRRFRRWAFESAALDLALRQAGTPLHEELARQPRPVTFVVSMRLGEPPSLERFGRIAEGHPNLKFKLDPTNSWDQELIRALAESGRVDSLDLKGHYRGTPVDVETDPELYRLLAESFPDAWLEDPDLANPEADEVLRPHRDRITWDAPIHSVADIDALPFPPRMVNIKPSRIGSLEELCTAYDYCAERGIGAYGGGQSELGPGRGQIQYLASLFHPDTPNDVAPSGFNLPEVPEGLPDSPLEAAASETGFRWG